MIEIQLFYVDIVVMSQEAKSDKKCSIFVVHYNEIIWHYAIICHSVGYIIEFYIELGVMRIITSRQYKYELMAL